MRRGKRLLKFMVSRRAGASARLALVCVTAAALAVGWRLSQNCSEALLLPRVHQYLDHFRINRSLKAYLDNITLLIRPSTAACAVGRLPVVAIVTSTPFHFEHRRSIRNTWGRRLPTFFVLGVLGSSVEDILVENYIEAKMYGDIIMYGFQEHYQNLTIKTGLLLKWMVDWCPMVDYLFKVDDDILVNPWTLHQVLLDNTGADLIGYRKENTYFHRDEYNKWYMPRWLYQQDMISEYLSGTGYLINGHHIKRILNAAYEVPMINLEDVYFTHMVAKLMLGLNLTHDRRLSPYKPWLASSCSYWGLASTHSHTPYDIANIWPMLEHLGERHDKGSGVCEMYDRYFSSELFLY